MQRAFNHVSILIVKDDREITYFLLSIDEVDTSKNVESETSTSAILWSSSFVLQSSQVICQCMIVNDGERLSNVYIGQQLFFFVVQLIYEHVLARDRFGQF